MKKIKALSVLAVIAFLIPLDVFAIGQMSQPIVIENAIRGEEYESLLTILNTDDYDQDFVFRGAGDITDWVSFYSYPEKEAISGFQIAKKSRKSAYVRIKVPDDIENKNYKGTIDTLTVPKEKEEKDKSSASVVQVVSRKVDISVGGKEVVKAECQIMPMDLHLKESEPMLFRVQCLNKGNIKIDPAVQQKVLKDGKVVFNAIYPYPETDDYIRPNSLGKWYIEWQTTGQVNGLYEVEMKVFSDDEIFQKGSYKLFLGISDDGDNNLSKYLSFISRVGGGNLTLGYLLVSGFLAVLTILFIAVNKKRRILRLWRKKA